MIPTLAEGDNVISREFNLASTVGTTVAVTRLKVDPLLMCEISDWSGIFPSTMRRVCFAALCGVGFVIPAPYFQGFVRVQSAPCPALANLVFSIPLVPLTALSAFLFGVKFVVFAVPCNHARFAASAYAVASLVAGMEIGERLRDSTLGTDFRRTNLGSRIGWFRGCHARSNQRVGFVRRFQRLTLSF
jgi:hypothetical protein